MNVRLEDQINVLTYYSYLNPKFYVRFNCCDDNSYCSTLATRNLNSFHGYRNLNQINEKYVDYIDNFKSIIYDNYYDVSNGNVLKLKPVNILSKNIKTFEDGSLIEDIKTKKIYIFMK